MPPPQVQTPPAPLLENAPALTLIVLTNLFPESRRALRFAAQLATQLGARLVMLHVEQTELRKAPRSGDGAYWAPMEMRLAMRAQAAEAHVSATIELTSQSLSSAAPEMARRYGPAVFVMGRPAVDHTSFSLITSVLDVMRTAQLPVLLVPESYTGAAEPATLAVAADFAPVALAAGAAAAGSLLHLLAPLRTTVLTVTPTPDEAACAAALHYVCASGLLSPRTQQPAVAGFQAATPELGLLQALATIQVSWLVMLARQRSLLGGLFHRSVTSRLLMLSPLPVLVVPATDG